MRVPTLNKNSDAPQRDVYEQTFDVFSGLWKHLLLKPLIVLFFIVQVVLAIFFALMCPIYLYTSSGWPFWGSTAYTLIVAYVTFLLGYFWFRVLDESDNW